MSMRGHSRGPGYLTQEEKDNAPKISASLLKRIISYLKPYILQLCLVIAAIIISAALGLLPSVITGRIIDEALIGKDMALLIKLVIYAFITLALSQVIGVLETYINTWISQRIIFDMKNQMYKHLEYMPHSFFTTEKQGDIITRMNTDIDGVSSVISGTMTNAISNLATVITTLTALFMMSWKLAIVGVLVVPLLIIPTRRVGRKRFNLLSESQAKHDELNQIINETLSVSGSLLVKLFTREQKEYERFRQVNEDVTKITLKEERSGSWLHVLFGMFTQIGPLLIYFAGGYFIISASDPNLTVGTITAMVALVNRMYRPIQTLLNLQVDFTRSLALFSRIFEYLDMKNDITDTSNPLSPDMTNPSVSFEDVSFSYSKDKPILKNVSFNIPGGSMYAIVGPSGAGKSTIVNLIARLYDTNKGSVNIAGVNLKDIKLSYLRDNIGLVTQDTYLFNSTIRENLLLAKEDATYQELEQACKTASIHDFIMSQPLGYDTVVGNRGLKLSGGEKQRMSIARVILKDPKIVILDEATSSLDSITENAIQTALDTVMRNRTGIIIAHRLSTVLAADSILVVSDGSVVQRGTHEELLKEGGIYKELYDTQFGKVLGK